MSSHREAPEISKDPVADSTDLYAFVSTDPNQSGTVTILANYVPLEEPAGGPNFYEFGDDVLYEIHIDNDADGRPDITYQFRFENQVRNPNTFLYNTGPITSLDDPSWNRRQFYSVTKLTGRQAETDSTNHKGTLLGAGLASPPCNIGPKSTPDYVSLAQAAVHTLPSGEVVYAGQRREGFYVDLGAIFDLGDLRPFQELHRFKMPPNPAPGVDATKTVNVHSIALQVPISQLTRDGSVPTDPLDPRAVIGVYTSASRRKVTIRDRKDGGDHQAGPFVQVSRLGNPLFNEVIVPMGEKDLWNALDPTADNQFLDDVQFPELGRLLPFLYPGVFPHLATIENTPRADLVAILLTGIPPGIVPGFQNTTGSTLADLLRLNMAIRPTGSPNPLGLLGGDPAGFPNGRRVFDDVVTVELRAIAGVTYPLVNPSYVPDPAAGVITQGVTPAPDRYIPTFPYLGVPLDGFHTPPS